MDDTEEETSQAYLTNLHAKVFVVQRARLAHVFVGSANATDGGFKKQFRVGEVNWSKEGCGALALPAVVMSYNGYGSGNRPRHCRPGCPHRHHRPAAGHHRAPGETDCPAGRAGQTQRSPTYARSETQSRPEACPAQIATQAAAPRLCPGPYDAHPAGRTHGGSVPRLRDPVVRRLGPAHSGSH